MSSNCRFGVSITGGGIRNAIVAFVMLLSLEMSFKDVRVDKKLYDIIDVVGGSEFGAVVAMTVALGQGRGPKRELNIKTVLKTITEQAKQIYVKRDPTEVKSGKSLYDPDALQEFIDKLFGDQTILQQLQGPVAIPTSSTQDSVNRIITNFTLRDDIYKYGNELCIVEAIMSSCSTPGLFPEYPLSYEGEYSREDDVMSGGQWGICPAEAVYKTICQSLDEGQEKSTSIYILSIGGVEPNDTSTMSEIEKKQLEIQKAVEERMSKQQGLHYSSIVLKTDKHYSMDCYDPGAIDYYFQQAGCCKNVNGEWEIDTSSPHFIKIKEFVEKYNTSKSGQLQPPYTGVKGQSDSSSSSLSSYNNNNDPLRISSSSLSLSTATVPRDDEDLKLNFIVNETYINHHHHFQVRSSTSHLPPPPFM